MHGVAYTVFQGTKPESMGVEVLGILRNANGPKGDIILVRLSGEKAEYTGVVAGMSGSPVYLNGKLAGALAFRIGEFSKEPIAGVTPIAEMLEINAMDRSPGSSDGGAKAAVHTPAQTSGPGLEGAISKDYANYLKPIEAPLVFSGFSQEAMQRFAPQFAKAGIVPVMGVGSVSESKQPEPLEPGSAISAILVRGDMDIAATCTVTYMDAQHLLACGHPSVAVRHGGFAHDQSGSAGDAALAAERFQDRKRHRAGRRICAGPAHRHHGRVRQAAGDDSGHVADPRQGDRQSRFRTSEQREPESAGHDGHGVQCACME